MKRTDRRTDGGNARARHSRRRRRQPPRTPSRRYWPTSRGTGAVRTPEVCCSRPPPTQPFRGPSPTPRLRNGRPSLSASCCSRNSAQSTYATLRVPMGCVGRRLDASRPSQGSSTGRVSFSQYVRSARNLFSWTRTATPP